MTVKAELNLILRKAAPDQSWNNIQYTIILSLKIQQKARDEGKRKHLNPQKQSDGPAMIFFQGTKTVACPKKTANVDNFDVFFL
jgi:hypothetical protein